MKNIYRVVSALLFVASATFAAQAYNISVAPEEGEELLLKDGDLISGTIDGTKKRKVKISVANNATITLSNAVVLGVDEGQFMSAGIRCLGNCTLVLEGKNIMKGYYADFPGVQVPDDIDGQKYTMTIKGNGSLEASSNGYGAGIGCNRYKNCGHLVISGGEIKAVGGYSAAGIGSSMNAQGGNIVIEGGEITAAGGRYAAGIGGGYKESECGNITISGGKIIAMGGEGAAGIGSGREASCKNITITKEVTKVVAIKGEDAPHSIGKGYGDDASVGTVTIGGVEGTIEKKIYVFPVPTTMVDIETVGGKTVAVINGDYSGNDAFSIENDIENVGRVFFDRTFPAVEGEDNYSTIMFPFEIKVNEVKNIKQVASFLGIGADEHNQKYVAVEQVWCDEPDATCNNDAVFEAYKPYLIQLKAGATGISINNTEPLVLKATPSEFDVMQNADYSQYGNYVFRGVVQGKTWGAEDDDVLGTDGAAAYGFAGTATSDISVGQFVKVGEGASIKPFRGYIYKNPVPKKVKSNGGDLLRQTASIDDLPDVMDIVVVDRKKDGSEQTTVIGQFNSRTGEIRLNRTRRTYDLKGRSVRDASLKAKGVYLKK